MDGFDGNGILRVLAVSGLAGFVVFCASYSLAVWIRRNRSGGSRGRFRKLSVALFLLGLVATAGIWISNRFEKHPGVVDRQNVFVVPGRAEARIEKLAPKGPVLEGQVLAVFRSPETSAQIAAVNSRIQETLMRIEAQRSQPLQYDQELLQARVQTRIELEQATSRLLELKRMMRASQTEALTLSTAWTRERSELLSELDMAARSYETAVDQIAIAEAAVGRAKGVLPVLQLETMSRNLLELRLERDRAEGTRAALRQRLGSLEQKYRMAEASLDAQAGEVDAEFAAARQRRAALIAASREIEKSLEEDRRRAEASAASEVDAARQHLDVLAEEKRQIIKSAEVRAPFGGNVVYRHPNPAFVPANAAAIAISPGSGIMARVLLPRSSVERLPGDSPVPFLLEDAVLENYFLGEFRGTEHVSLGDDRVIARFDAELPSEAFTMLGNEGKSLSVQLLWSPSLVANPYFIGSIGLVALGALGQMLSLARPRRRASRTEFLWPLPPDTAEAALPGEGAYGLAGPQTRSQQSFPGATRE